MEADSNSVSLTATLGLSAASLVLNIIGLAIPFWRYSNDGKIKYYSGLWLYCEQPKGGDASCTSFEGRILDDESKATRAMEVLGMLIILAAMVCALLKLLVMKENALLYKISAGCAIAAGSFMIIGTIIYSTLVLLNAGFALCIIAGVIGIVAGVVMFFGSNVINS